LRALAHVVHPRLRLHFVAHVDGDDLATTLAGLAPEETLFVVASKTFTTQDTNPETARRWFLGHGGLRIDEHFVAATTSRGRRRSASHARSASETGLAAATRSGRPSGCRSPSRSAPTAFARCSPARAIDEHFTANPIARNVPTLLGLLEVWYRN